MPVERPELIETTAAGAAGLAGIAAGIWASAEEFLATRRFIRFEPSKENSRADELGEWRRAVRAALAWARDRT